jgi:hypothetical protein
MRYQNTMLMGVLLALPFPFIAWVVAYLLRHNADIIINKPALPYIIAIALNLLLLRFVIKKDLDKTARGIMLATFAIMIALFMFKIRAR